RAARAELRVSLDAIRRTALALAVDDVGFAIKFPLPRGNGDSHLLTISRVFAAHAADRAAEFVALGLPPSFLDDLAAGIDAVETARRERGQNRTARAASRTALETAFDEGFRVLRKLDAVVPNVFRGDALTLLAWQRARRVTGERRTRPEGTSVVPS